MPSPTLFDRLAIRRNHLRAACTGGDGFFMFDEVSRRLADRLLDIQRTFPIMADLSGRGDALQHFAAAGALRARQVDFVIRLAEAPALVPDDTTVIADREVFPLADDAIDLAVSVLAFHNVNDLPGSLIQVRRALRPDGLLLAALFGGETLSELRRCLEQAEIEVSGGLSPRVIPFADVRDLGGLLQRAGFALPVTDVDRITTTYGSATDLMRDLRFMGEANPLSDRPRTFMRKAVLARTEALYRSRHGTSDGRIPATFDIVYLTGWAPHESQQKPLRPGQATTRLADALGATEQSAGDKAQPKK